MKRAIFMMLFTVIFMVLMCAFKATYDVGYANGKLDELTREIDLQLKIKP